VSADTEVSHLKSTDFHRSAIAFDSQIPLFYAWAMGIDAIGGLTFGRQVRSHRHLGPNVCSDFFFTFCPIGILRKRAGAIARNDFMGYRYGIQESILKAAVAGLVPADKRGSAYGIFNTAMAYHRISGQFGDGNFVRSLNYLAGCIFSCDPTP
jgi:hypothetical protein